MNWFRRKKRGIGYRVKGTGTGLLSDHEKQEAVHRKKITNDDAGRFCEADRNRSWPKRLLKIRPVQLRLPLSLSSIFRGDNDTDNQKNDPQGGHSDSTHEGEFFKKICGQTDGDNSFAKVGNHFPDEFPAFVADDKHRLNNNMLVMGCQEECLSGARS